MEYEVAKIEDFGYKEHKVAKTIWKIMKYVIAISTIALLYLSIFIILLQSVNKSVNPNEFTGFTFNWYLNIAAKRSLWNAIKNTFLVSIAATLISVVLGTFIAVGIYSLSKKHQKIMMLLNNIPLLNADIVTGVGLMLVFSFVVKLFPYIFGLPTLIIAHVFFTFPYVILSVLPKLKELDPNMFEASLDLGVKPFKSLLKVIIPSIVGGIFSGMVLAFTMSFDDFVISYYTTGNGFDTFSIWVYSSIGRKSLSPSAYAFSTIVTLVSAVAVLALNFIKPRGKKHAKK